jgi:hypothetical protein
MLSRGHAERLLLPERLEPSAIRARAGVCTPVAGSPGEQELARMPI